MSEHSLDGEEGLDFSRQNMIKALELFFEHTKCSLTLMISVLTAVLAIAAFAVEKNPSGETLRLIAYVSAAMLFLLVPVAYVSYKLVERYYKLYVTCYVYAARLHKKHAVATHPWFLDLEKRVGDVENSDAVETFIASGSDEDGHSWYFYSKLIILLGALGLIGSFLILGWVWLSSDSPPS